LFVASAPHLLFFKYEIDVQVKRQFVSDSGLVEKMKPERNHYV